MMQGEKNKPKREQWQATTVKSGPSVRVVEESQVLLLF